MESAALILRDEFIGRDDEIRAWRRTMNALREGATPFETVVAFIGPVGIGKTRLLRELQHQAGNEGLPYAYVTLHKDTSEEGLLKDLENSIIHSLSLKVTSLIPDRSLSLSADRFLNYVRTIQSFYSLPVLFFIDTLDQCHPDLFGWLERKLLNPLVNTNRTLISIGSRRRLEWVEFDIRRRAQETELSPFNIDETQKQIGWLAEVGTATEFAKKLQQLTFGLPGANQFLAKELSHRYPNGHIGQEVLDTSDLRKELMSKLVKDYLFRDIDDSDLQEVLLRLADSPQFDYDFLRNEAHNLPASYADPSFSALRKLMVRLQETALVEWNPSRKGYVVKSSVRDVLSTELAKSVIIHNKTTRPHLV